MSDGGTATSKSVSWDIFLGVCETDGAVGLPTYGVRATWEGGEWSFPDVHVSRAVTEELVRRLRGADLEPCHFADVVQDFIQEQG